MSGSSRSVWCQSFSSVRRLEAEKMPKIRNANFPSFRFGRFGIPFGSIDIASEGRGGPLWLMSQFSILQKPYINFFLIRKYCACVIAIDPGYDGAERDLLWDQVKKRAKGIS